MLTNALTTLLISVEALQVINHNLVSKSKGAILTKYSLLLHLRLWLHLRRILFYF